MTGRPGSSCGRLATLVAQAILDPATGGSGEVMYAAATDQRGALLGSAALLIVSGVLTVPAAMAIMNQARDRGAWLADVGGGAAVLGGFGHVGIGLFYVLAAALAGGDRGEMVEYMERLNGSTALAVTALPLIACFAMGVLLLPWAAFRAGLCGLVGAGTGDAGRVAAHGPAAGVPRPGGDQHHRDRTADHHVRLPRRARAADARHSMGCAGAALTGAALTIRANHQQRGGASASWSCGAPPLRALP